ncbi:hypothetical protein D3C77_456740 [compost metagenome]
MRPTRLGVEQSATGQRYTCHRLRLLATQALQQLPVEGIGQGFLTLLFLAVEGQLQYTASVPILPPLQALKQASGVAETTQNQTRQRRAMGR